MRVLLLGSRSAERIRVMNQLTAAGMSVAACKPGDWECTGMHGECPLDAEEIDVAVAVASRGRRIDAVGLGCTQRARIPLVTIGATANDPALRFARGSVTHADESIVDVVRAAGRDHDHRVARLDVSVSGSPPDRDSNDAE